MTEAVEVKKTVEEWVAGEVVAALGGESDEGSRFRDPETDLVYEVAEIVRDGIRAVLRSGRHALEGPITHAAYTGYTFFDWFEEVVPLQAWSALPNQKTI